MVPDAPLEKQPSPGPRRTLIRVWAPAPKVGSLPDLGGNGKDQNESRRRAGFRVSEIAKFSEAFPRLQPSFSLRESITQEVRLTDVQGKRPATQPYSGWELCPVSLHKACQTAGSLMISEGFNPGPDR